MLNLILFGPPGSGKGTQSARLACRFNLVHISTGDLFRQEARRATHLGRKMAWYMNNGLLVPDHIVLKKVYMEAIRHTQSAGLVFDGFPRTLHQAMVLDRMLEKKGTSVSIVFQMVVDEAELVNRIMGRGTDSGRSDDNEETIWRRLETYHAQTRPLENYYSDQNKLITIVSMAPVKQVSDKMVTIVEHFNQNKEIPSFA